jgi:hypothetical protein
MKSVKIPMMKMIITVRLTSRHSLLFFLFTYTIFLVSRLPYKMLLQSCMLHLSADSGSRRSPRCSSGKKQSLQLDHDSMKKSTLKRKQSLTEELLERDDDSSVEYSCSEEKPQDNELSSD